MISYAIFQQPTRSSSGRRASLVWKVAIGAVVLISVIAILAVSCRGRESECEAEGGIVLTHTFAGNKWCDFPPFDEILSDIGGRDYVID